MTDITEIDITPLLKNKPLDISKKGNGSLFSLCGSTYFRGAAYMSSAAALRTGVGLIRLASIESVISSVANTLPECTFLPLKEEKGIISCQNWETVSDFANSATAFLCGCGLSCCDETQKLIKRMLPKIKVPCVLDADALNCISDNPEILKSMSIPPIITPHYAEMARLCHTNYEDIKITPLAYATSFAQQYNVYVVLKGAVTHVVTPKGEMFENNFPNPGLAKGGSGDVLAGTIASLSAQGYTQINASVCGVAIHSKAARLCLSESTPYSMLPTDILQYYPCVFAKNE